MAKKPAKRTAKPKAKPTEPPVTGDAYARYEGDDLAEIQLRKHNFGF